MPEVADRFSLAGQVAVVTGGSRGLGFEMSLAFAELGASVVIASRKGQACEAAAAQIAHRTGVRTLGVACNVGDWHQCDTLVETVYDAFGSVEILVNNAGLSPLYESLDTVSRDLFDKVVGINLAGPFRLAALIGPRMAEGKGGSIINISSMSVHLPTPRELPYAAAKAGLNTMTLGLATAFGPTVRVNAIQAGPFLTDISHAWDRDVFTRFAADHLALGRAGSPEEIIGAAVFFASRASSYCTGSILRVDGGLH